VYAKSLNTAAQTISGAMVANNIAESFEAAQQHVKTYLKVSFSFYCDNRAH